MRTLLVILSLLAASSSALADVSMQFVRLQGRNSDGGFVTLQPSKDGRITFTSGRFFTEFDIQAIEDERNSGGLLKLTLSKNIVLEVNPNSSVGGQITYVLDTQEGKVKLYPLIEIQKK